LKKEDGAKEANSMKKFDIRKSFTDRRFKHGAYSTIATIIVLAILAAFNLAAGKLNIKKDLTQDKLYTLTKETNKILTDLENHTKIMVFFETGKKDPNISALVEKYKAASNKLIIEEKDPITQPQLAQKYSKDDKIVGIGSIVVESDSRFKTISYDDFYNYSIGEYGEENIDSFSAEQQITNAIIYVNSEKEQILYALTGHGETALSSEVTKQLVVENYTVKQLNLLQGNAELSQDSMLVISSPQRDISKEEGDKIKTFLINGGRAAFFVDITREVFPNLEEVLNFYGVKLQNTLIVEGQAERVAQSQIELLPELQPQEILNAIKSNNMLIMIPLSQGIQQQEIKRDTIKIVPLLTTSTNSWGKVDLNTTTLTKEVSDLTGPFNVAVAITDEDKSTGKTAKMVVVGSSNFMSSDVISATNGANLDFVMNSFNWLQDKKDGTSIRPKDLTVQNLTMTNLQRLTLSAVVVVLIPGVIIAAGIIVWLRQRHR
jgi:ABC-2 type transport system permease protein